MKLGTAIYQYVGKKQNKRLKIVLDTKEVQDTDCAMNCVGMGWLDTEYGLIKSLLLKYTSGVFVTDTDLLSHNDYLTYLNRNQTIILVNLGGPVSASRKRLLDAKAIMQAAGFKVKLISKGQFEKKFNLGVRF